MNRLAEPGYLAEALGAEPFDAAYANFGAINCVQDLAAFAKALAPALRPGAPLLLTVMGPWGPWSGSGSAGAANSARRFAASRVKEPSGVASLCAIRRPTPFAAHWPPRLSQSKRALSTHWCPRPTWKTSRSRIPNCFRPSRSSGWNFLQSRLPSFASQITTSAHFRRA